MNPDCQPSDREQALRQIAALARLHGLKAQDLVAALADGIPAPPPTEKSSTLLNRLFLYLGGVFVFGGLCALAHVLWDDLPSAQRVILSLGSGLVSMAMGIVSLRDPRFEKAATPFFLISAALQPTGLFVFLHEYIPEGNDPQLAALCVFGLMAAQQAILFWKTDRTSLLFFALVFGYGTLGITFNRTGIPTDIGLTVMGLSMLCVARTVQKTVHRLLTPLGYFAGTLILLVGYFDIVENTPVELTFLGLSAFLIYLSLCFSSRTILFLSVAGLLSYLGWYTAERFSGVVGWPVALIVLGFVFLGLGALTVRLSRRIPSA